MNQEFRNSVQNVAQSAVNILGDYFSGNKHDDAKLKMSLQAMRVGVQIEHMNQINEHRTKSNALRLVQFLPQDQNVRQEYIAMTNPEIKPYLAARPKVA